MAGKRRAGESASTRPSKRPAKSAQKGPFFTKARALRAFKWSGITGLVMALIGVGGFLYLYNAIDIPDANADFQAERTVVTYAGGEKELGKFAVQDRDVIAYDEMPQNIKDAVVAAENRSFWTDNGIDVKGILRAALNNASGNSTEGASTITQQLVKILYLNQEQSYTRKVKEAILALKIHRQISKEQVLTDYLNTIYFGRGAYGIEAAAEAYFGKDAKDLNLRQSAFLASVLNDPNDLDPADGKDARSAVKERYRYTLGSMAAIETISSDEAEKAQKRLPKFDEQDAEDTDTYGGQKGHMLAMVRAELYRLGYTDDEIDRGGLKIETTFTPSDMKAAEEGVIAGRPEGFGDKQLHVGAAIVEPGTGAVRGFYGGQDYLQSQLNWAVRGGMAGSTFKPFAVATALDQGYSLKSTFEGNSPIEIGGTDFENQGDRDYGSRVSLLEATENSINTAFIDLTDSLDNGPDSIIEMANKMGIPPEKATRKIRGFPNRTPGLEANLQVALGSQTVSPINMANGYATIANHGEAAEPYIIERVESAEGTWTHKVKTHEAFSPEIASDVSYAMQQVVKSGSGTAAQALGRPAAGKTGTATRTDGAVTSAWFAGFTPQRSTAVMYARGKGVGQLDGWLPSYFGGDYPAETWTEIMTRAMDGLPIEEFPEPALLEEEDPPSDDHAPYTPPPPPEKTKEPKTTEPTEPTEPTKPPKTSKPPKPTEPTEPTEPSTPSDCEFLGNCPTDDGNNGGGNTGGGGQGREVVATRETSAQRSSLLA